MNFICLKYTKMIYILFFKFLQHDYIKKYSRKGCGEILLVDLGCKIEPDVAVVFNGVFNEDRDIRRHTKNDRFAQAGGLGEEIHVS